EEGVALTVDLDPLVLCKGIAQENVVLGEQLAVALAPELLEELRRALDIGEEKGNRPARELSCPCHRRPCDPFRTVRVPAGIVLWVSGFGKSSSGESCGQLGSGRDLELAVDARQVHLDGFRRHEESLCDRLVR